MSVLDSIAEVHARLKTIMVREDLSISDVARAIPLPYTTVRSFLYGAPLRTGTLVKIEAWCACQDSQDRQGLKEGA